MKLRFLGGAKEVGRSAIHVDTGSERFLMDYGIDVQDMKIPIRPELNLTAVLLSHAHMDHSGLLPELYKRGYSGSVYATPVTFGLCSLLLKDSIKVQKIKGERPYFLHHDIKRMERLRKEVRFREPVVFGKSKVEFYDAGHIPGSSMIMVESAGKRVLYTGDVKFIDTELMKGADTNIEDVDVIISESTYSYKDHPDRVKLTDRLREYVQNTVYNNGIVVLPSFAVGRTQEMLVIMSKLGFKMTVDGMGIEAADIILRYPDTVRDPKTLSKVFGRALKISKGRQRDQAIEEPGVIITTAGMLSGGPVGYYIQKLYQRPDCMLILTGYQVENTVGRILMDTGSYVNEGLNIKPRMKVEFMDFSAHTDRTHLIKFYKKLNPEKIILVHGDHRIEDFGQELSGMGFKTAVPENGQKIEVK
jgi:putative mRNA 3-end processing factor